LGDERDKDSLELMGGNPGTKLQEERLVLMKPERGGSQGGWVGVGDIGVISRERKQPWDRKLSSLERRKWKEEADHSEG